MTPNDTIEHGDPITSRDEANQAAIEQDLLLRVQPPAPAPTKLYFADDGAWYRRVCGRDTADEVDVETVRRVVDRAIERNDRPGGGIKAVSQRHAAAYIPR